MNEASKRYHRYIKSLENLNEAGEKSKRSRLKQAKKYLTFLKGLRALLKDFGLESTSEYADKLYNGIKKSVHESAGAEGELLTELFGPNFDDYAKKLLSFANQLKSGAEIIPDIIDTLGDEDEIGGKDRESTLYALTGNNKKIKRTLDAELESGKLAKDIWNNFPAGRAEEFINSLAAIRRGEVYGGGAGEKQGSEETGEEAGQKEEHAGSPAEELVNKIVAQSAETGAIPAEKADDAKKDPKKVMKWFSDMIAKKSGAGSEDVSAVLNHLLKTGKLRKELGEGKQSAGKTLLEYGYDEEEGHEALGSSASEEQKATLQKQPSVEKQEQEKTSQPPKQEDEGKKPSALGKGPQKGKKDLSKKPLRFDDTTMKISKELGIKPVVVNKIISVAKDFFAESKNSKCRALNEGSELLRWSKLAGVI